MAKINVGSVFYYCIIACVQIYILMGTGFILYYRKILAMKNSSIISGLLLNFLIPVYAFTKIAETVDLQFLNTYWIIVVNFVVCLWVGYAISHIFHILLKMDIRVKECFASLITIPSIGGLPLVISKGYCFPDGPIEGDSYCQHFLGMWMCSFLIFNIFVYVIAYFWFVIDRNNNEDIEKRICYLWHDVCDRYFNGKNTVIEYYMKIFTGKDDIKNIEKLIFEFNSDNNKIPKDRNGNIMYYTKMMNLIRTVVSKEKLEIFEKCKKEVIDNLNLIPQKFPYNKNIVITSEMLRYLISEMKLKEETTKELDPAFTLNIDYLEIDRMAVLRKMLVPPIIGVLLGIIFSVSDWRSILFDNNNIFFISIADGFSVIANIYTPIWFLWMGWNTAAALFQGEGDSLVGKIHIIVLWITKFVILPTIGMINIWLWTKFYGGIVETSTAYRLMLFSHWCQPPPSNLTIWVNMTNYFSNEYGYLLGISNISCIIGWSLLNLIYFLLVGL